MAKFITKKDFFNAIIATVKNAMAEGADIDWGKVDLSTKDCARVEEITSEMVIEFCEKEIANLTKKSSTKSSKPSKTQVENTALAENVTAWLSEVKNGIAYGKEIAKEFDLSTSKVTAIMKLCDVSKESTKDGVIYTLN